MRRWPPIVWPLMSIASLLILMGGTGNGRPPFLIAGGILALTVLGISLYLATRGLEDRPDHPGFHWAMAGLALFYILVAAAGGIAGPEYALAGLAAGVIPLAALGLIVATARAKTDKADSQLRDATAGDAEDPFPGLGLDDDTPLGDSPQISDARTRRA
jgi:hypothetical protein